MHITQTGELLNMNVYELYKGDCLFAFEIENSYIGLHKVKDLLCTVEGVTDIKCRRIFSAISDVHIKFMYKDRSFIVWEPYGDNSRYWIGPEDDDVMIELDSVEVVFKNYKPHFIRRLIGDLLTFNF